MDNIENKPIAAGDVVTLKSGGMAMTVEGMESPPNHLIGRQLPGTQMARCVWMDEIGAVGERLIWPHLLVVKGVDGPQSLKQDLWAHRLMPTKDFGTQAQGLSASADADAKSEIAGADTAALDTTTQWAD